MAKTQTPQGVRMAVADRTTGFVSYEVFRNDVHVGFVVGRQESHRSPRKMWDYKVGTEFSWSRDAMVYTANTAGQALDNLLFALDH